MLKSIRISSIIGASLLLMLAPSAKAGPEPTTGSSPDSSTPAGDSFVPIEATIVPEPEAGTPVEVDVRSGNITTSPELLTLVNDEAVGILTRLARGQVNSATLNGESSLLPQNTQAVIVALLIANATTDISPQIEALDSEISLPGVSPEVEQGLLSAFAGICKCSLGAELDSEVAIDFESGVSVEEILPQCGRITVDLNRLSEAITAYNDVVTNSTPEDLELLANDPEFLVMGQVLRELRAPLNTSSS